MPKGAGWDMKTKVTIGMVAAVLLAGLAGAANSQTPEFDRVFRAVTPQNQNQNQKQNQKAPQRRVAVQKRAPTRIIVRPLLRERLDSTEFPRSDYLGYPGPNAVRQCVSWLQPEYRLSGTVVTPQMRCWWQRG
jgi:hypothetical protein